MPSPRPALFAGAAALLLAVPILSGAQAPAPAPVQVLVRTDRVNALYSPGETATFTIRARRGGARVKGGTVLAQLSEDGYRPLGLPREVTLDETGTGSLQASLGEPGFLRCFVTYEGEGAKGTGMAAAGYDPERIEPATRMPSDFDRFWERNKAELAAIPMEPQAAKSDGHSTAEVDVYKVNLRNVGDTRVYGWLSVPKTGTPLPAVLVVPGAGVYPQGPSTQYARQGALTMNISIHNMDVDLPQSAYTGADRGPLNRYMHQGKTDRDAFYYRRVVLGCVRAIDYLTSRPEWNRKHVAVVGGSQGGALSLITGGVDPRVTAISPNVAAMCDHNGFTKGRVSGWPQLAAGLPEEEKAKVAKVSPYYDAVNFARKFRGPSLHGVGFIDTVCPPTTVYAAYNACRGPKEMVTSPLMGHSTDPRFVQKQAEFLKAHFASEPR